MVDSVVPSPSPSQLSEHGATRIELPGRYGPIAALRTRAKPAADTAGPVALLVPGYTGSKEDFAPLLDPVTRAGLDAIAIDLPGQYESPGPDDESAYLPGPLGMVVAELVGKLAAEGHTVLLLGHSFGGLVARSATLTGAPIAGLTLLASGPAELPTGWRRYALDLGEPALRQGGTEAAQRLREALEDQSVTASRPPELAAFLRTRFLRSLPASLLGMAEGLRNEPDLVSQLGVTLKSAGAPCLVVCGAGDDAWPVATQRDMADRLDADFAMIPDSAHSPNVENPDGLLATLLPTWRTWLGS